MAEAQQALATLVAHGTRIQQALEATRRQLAELAAQLNETLAKLDGAFANAAWRQAWGQSPAAFVDQCRSQAAAWTQQQDACTQLSQQLQGLGLQLAGLDSACAQASQQRDAQLAACNAVSATLQAYRQQRSQLLEGRPLAEVEASLAAALAQAQAALDSARLGADQSAADATRLQETLRQASLALAQHRTSHSQARAALDNWLAAFNAQPRNTAAAPALALADLQPLLAISPAWISTERAALQAIRSAVTTAQGVLASRTQSLAAHAASKAAPETADALQAQLHQSIASIASLAETLSALRLDLARDDERLQASTTLRQQIAQQATVAKVWAQLGELIGSADGKKFRNFAQQLTLDILLGYGNRHLQSLTSRYRLERIKDSLGLLVVDQDMGDEVRSVHSLSGGESFLVSLAMALGLASLSSHRVRVESLFIDEGFGSLDADSLRVAMDALDNLQAQGRKVGVISHVQEMTERIGTRVQVQRQAGGLSRIVVA